MKQINVNNNCSGCGLCTINSIYLKENDEGYAQPIPGKAIKDSDINELKEIIEKCPEKALSIIETGKATVSGKAGVKQIIEILKKQCQSIKVKEITNLDVKFNIKQYRIFVPYTRKDIQTYSSESAAKSVAKDEFNRLCYSEYACKPLIKKVFVEYKVNILKPYYICEDIPESAYYKYNEIIRKQLADAYAEICDLLGEEKLSKSWKDFSFYLKAKEFSIEYLKNFDINTSEVEIINELKSLSKTTLNDYILEMDFDYYEDYIGTGLFGSPKYKKVWKFSGFDGAVRSFINDLTWAIDYKADDIEQNAVCWINEALQTFEKEVKKVYMNKIEELEKII